MKKEADDKLLIPIGDKQLYTLEVLIGLARLRGINPSQAYIYVDHSSDETGMYSNTDIDTPRARKLEEFDYSSNSQKLAALNAEFGKAKEKKKKDKEKKDKDK